MYDSRARGPWVWKWGALPGELPHAVGSVPRRKLSDLQDVGWERDTRCCFPWEWGWPGIVFNAPSSPAAAVRGGSVGQKVLCQGAPRRRLQDQALGEPPGQGLSEAPVPDGDGVPVYGNPILSPRTPSVQVVTGWPVCVLLGPGAGACL